MCGGPTVAPRGRAACFESLGAGMDYLTVVSFSSEDTPNPQSSSSGAQGQSGELKRTSRLRDGRCEVAPRLVKLHFQWVEGGAESETSCAGLSRFPIQNPSRGASCELLRNR